MINRMFNGGGREFLKKHEKKEFQSFKPTRAVNRKQLFIKGWPKGKRRAVGI